MPLNSSLKDKLVKIQEKEITEYNVYRRVSESTKGQNSKILKQISEDELRHYNEWKEYSHTEVNPDRLVVLKYLIISKIFGIMFMMKLLEEMRKKPKQITQK